jgi:hypothetical protein
MLPLLVVNCTLLAQGMHSRAFAMLTVPQIIPHGTWSPPPVSAAVRRTHKGLEATSYA